MKLPRGLLGKMFKGHDDSAGTCSERVCIAPALNSTGESTEDPGPVLLELFTSQGCSSCPPADHVLSKLGRGSSAGVPVVALAYHVDYWDYLGWKDPFGSAQASERQRAYGRALTQCSVYTPQLVVQGAEYCVGSSAKQVESLISTAPRYPAPDIEVTTKQLETILRITLVASTPAWIRDGKHGTISVMIALYESKKQTKCSRGENRGKNLVNDCVVRDLKQACQLAPDARAAKSELQFLLAPGTNLTNCGLVVFLQDLATMQVYGVKCVNLTDA
eukprot:SM000051S17584  [mRNA]  locus=s51:580524:581838:- [translate_table: standard]